MNEKQESIEEKKDRRDRTMCENYLTTECPHEGELDKWCPCHKWGCKS